ncbi:MAG: hypothetical protein KDA65_00430 [Planctomycetaceae bacterium]|nr:hypothetical protein [Planctomycetaceae bacterium]
MNSEPEPTAPVSEPTRTLPKPRRSRWRIALQMALILLIFGGGVLTGGALTVKFIRHRMENFEEQSDTMVERLHWRITRKYDLNEEQSAQVKQALRKNLDDLIELRREFRPRLAAELGTIEEDIAVILDEPKRQEWRENFRSFCEITFPGVYQPNGAESTE